MSKPKEARDRLFKHGRPNIRPLDILEEGGIGKDMAVLWAAYRKGSFPEFEDITQEDFTREAIEYLRKFYYAWMIEDKNYNFPSGSGPVALVVARFNGWEMEPHIHHFSWSTPKNRVRSVVSFMQMARYEKGVGVLNLYLLDEFMEFFKYISKIYGVIYYVGRIPRGLNGGNKSIFYGRGGDFFKKR